ncbi:hypothetical protein KALB_7896 [Kutzneria albida DSM 43870]|uniref:Uncharacterized protein n=2 Tax=Kutzneria TaxID=43356 RepID=W5WJ75_9PSEU|nr:hypothetical protein KALB_7896 [Kutzneria albida DSM 43870]
MGGAALAGESQLSSPEEIPPSGGSHTALSDALRDGPFHQALHQAILAKGLSLARLRAQLDTAGAHIGQSTLSYWQRGLRRPEMPRATEAVLALEQVLDLPVQSLLSLLEPISDGSARQNGAVEEIEQDLRNSGLRLRALHEVVTVNAARSRRSVLNRIVVEALEHGADRYLALHQADERGRVEHSAVHTAEGCRAGRVRKRAPDGSVAFELLFDRKLAVGDTHVFSYSVVDTASGQTGGHVRRFAAPVGNYLLQLRFHRGVLPARCFREVHGPDVEVSELHYGLDGVVSAYFEPVEAERAGITVLWGQASGGC